jgi:hypothetical protein
MRQGETFGQLLRALAAKSGASFAWQTEHGLGVFSDAVVA